MKLNFKVIFIYFALLLLIGNPEDSFCNQKALLTAKAVIIMDAETGKILYQRNSNMKLPAASTVKVLTAVMSIERLDLNRQLVISKRAAGIAPSKAYLTEKEKYRVEDLLMCILMSSANDAGVALAESMAETEFRFSLLMNDQAKEWGANSSFFLNATGLPEYKKRQYSTVNDLALFMKKSATYPKLVDMMEKKYANIKGTDGKVIKLKNHNKFLWNDTNDLIGKTGYTRKAKHCFLGLFTKNKRKLIVAMLGSRKLWDDLNYLLKKNY